MSQSRILAFAGSTRSGSFNKFALRAAVQGATAAGAEVTWIDLKEFPLPLFDQELEQTAGMPESAVKLKQLFRNHDGLLIASPEYNSSITPLLKNTLDWVSRGSAGETPLAAYVGKVAALVSASPGSLGGLRGLIHLRSILGNIQVMVLPEQMAIPNAMQVFDEAGNFKEARLEEKVSDIGQALAKFLARLHP